MEFNFDKASSFYHVTGLKIDVAGGIFQRSFLALENIFFQEQLF